MYNGRQMENFCDKELLAVMMLIALSFLLLVKNTGYLFSVTYKYNKNFIINLQYNINLFSEKAKQWIQIRIRKILVV